MPLGTLQLNSLGPQDFHLTANPQITFFKSVFRRHTNFSVDIQRIYFEQENPSFGSKESTAKIDLIGDLLGHIYLEATVTGTSTKKGAYTVNHFGNSLIDKIMANIFLDMLQRKGSREISLLSLIWGVLTFSDKKTINDEF